MTTTTEAATTELKTIEIIAPSVFAAQGFDDTPEFRAALTAKADQVRAIANTTAKTSINVPVREFPGGAAIGYLTFSNV